MAFKQRIITRNEGCGKKFQKGDMSSTLYSTFCAIFNKGGNVHSKQIKIHHSPV